MLGYTTLGTNDPARAMRVAGAAAFFKYANCPVASTACSRCLAPCSKLGPRTAMVGIPETVRGAPLLPVSYHRCYSAENGEVVAVLNEDMVDTHGKPVRPGKIFGLAAGITGFVIVRITNVPGVNVPASATVW